MEAAGTLIGRYLEAGNFGAAEQICRRTLAGQSGDRAAALLGLAWLARRYGLLNHERLFLERLAKPFATPFSEPLALDHIVPKRTVAGGAARYLVINAWGEGFWSDTSHVVGCCALAWLSGRIPVTNWRAGSLYADRTDADAFLDFFEPIGRTKLAALDLAALSIFPRYWTPDLLLGTTDRPLPDKFAGPALSDILLSDADVVVCDRHVSPAAVLHWIIPAAEPTREEIAGQLAALLARCCRPIARWRHASRDYIRRTFGAEPYVAFHLRGTDKAREHRRSEDIARRIADTVDRIASDRPIFLMTDDAGWRDAMAARFGGRLRHTEARRGTGRASVHRSPDPAASRHRRPRRRLGGEILCDSLIAAQAQIFVGDGESNVAAMIDLMIPPRTGRSELLSPNQLLELRDWVIHW